MSSDIQQDGRRGERLVEAILSLEPIVFVDALGVPTIQVPLTASLEARQPIAIKSERVMAELSGIAWEFCNILCFIQELHRIVQLLIGMAYKDDRTDVELENLFDQDPFLEALAILMSDPRHKNGYSDTATELLNQLKVIAVKHSLQTKSPLWPTSAEQIGRGLNKRSSALDRHLHCSIERIRSPDASRIIIIRKKLPSDSNIGSLPNRCQVDNCRSSNALTSVDSADGKVDLQRLFDSVDSNKGEKNE